MNGFTKMLMFRVMREPGFFFGTALSVSPFHCNCLKETRPETKEDHVSVQASFHQKKVSLGNLLALLFGREVMETKTGNSL